jgi:Flp pilus assembly protein TadG
MPSKISQYISKYLSKPQRVSTNIAPLRFIPKFLTNKKGVALILVALAIFLLIALAALAIDIAYMYVVKNELQVAADAAALAGAAKLTGVIDSGGTVSPELNARKEAWKFACKNKAAGSPVYLETNNSTDCNSPPSSALNESNNPNRDIIVGNWDQNTRTFTPATGNTNLAINAIKIVPRRSDAGSGYGMGPVGIFFGRVLGLIPGSQAWPVMSVRAEAVAAIGLLPTSGISICLATCNLSPPISLDVREQTSGSAYGLSWTQLDQASPIGTQSCTTNNCRLPLDNDCSTDPHKKVAALIWGLIPAPNVCGQSITTQNGVANALDDLGCAFKSLTYDVQNKVIENNVVKKWKVVVPVQEKCPAGKEPGPWPVVRYARLEISEVSDTGQLKGIKITDIKCVPCNQVSELGGRGVALVK